MTPHLVNSARSLASFQWLVCTISLDILDLIFDEATYDRTWDDYPPPPQGYADSPLATAVAISQVCKKWRRQIISMGYLWGRLLNTSYYSTHNNSLWKQVYLRSGDTSPIWLKHVDSQPYILINARRLTQLQMYQFVHMFLLVIHNVPVQRIRRLELNVWHREFLINLPARTRSKIREAAACHVTHLKLGNVNSDYSDGPSGTHDQDTDDQMTLARREHAEAIPLMLLELVFGDTLSGAVHINPRSLRRLCIYGVSVPLRDLLVMLKSMPLLEELHLEQSSYHGRIASVMEPSPPSPSDTVHLPHLQMIRIGGMWQIAVTLVPSIRLCAAKSCCTDTSKDDGELDLTKFWKHNCCVHLG